MKEQFCSYEIALKLKELRFNEGCFAAYYPDGELIGLKWYDNNNHRLELPKIAAPLWQQVIDWLREKHGYYINTDDTFLTSTNTPQYKYRIYPYNYKIGCKDKAIFSEYFLTYQEAREKAILKAIELLKK